MTNDVIRDLVAYGDTVGRSAVQLVMDIESMDTSDRTNGARAIIENAKGMPLTDSDIDDLMDILDDDDDMFND
jgi:hypothetical protein